MTKATLLLSESHIVQSSNIKHFFPLDLFYCVDTHDEKKSIFFLFGCIVILTLTSLDCSCVCSKSMIRSSVYFSSYENTTHYYYEFELVLFSDYNSSSSIPCFFDVVLESLSGSVLHNNNEQEREY